MGTQLANNSKRSTSFQVLGFPLYPTVSSSIEAVSPNDSVFQFKLILVMRLYLEAYAVVVQAVFSQRSLVLVILVQTPSSTLPLYLLPDPILLAVSPVLLLLHLCSSITYILFLPIWEFSIRKARKPVPCTMDSPHFPFLIEIFYSSL